MPLKMASPNASFPSPAMAFTSAPAATRSRADSTSPSRAANINEVNEPLANSSTPSPEREGHAGYGCVPARPECPDQSSASLLARAVWVVGVDTGLTHLAAALGTPTVAIFTVTDPQLAGVARATTLARDLGGTGNVPTSAEVIAALGPLVRAVPSS